MSDEVTEHATLEEAIAVAVAESAPGDVVIVHAATCETDDETSECPCGPEIIVAVAGGAA